MSNRKITVMWVGQSHDGVRRFEIDRGRFNLALTTTIALSLALLAAFAHYIVNAPAVFETRALRQENASLQTHVDRLQAQLDVAERDTIEVRKLDAKLRALTDIGAAPSGLAMGPLRWQAQDGDAAAREIDAFAVPMGGQSPDAIGLNEALLDSRVGGLSREAEVQRRSLTDLLTYFQARAQLLASTPSIWPARGWITSTFGRRSDPFTGERIMHAGIDIAAPAGTKVIAPAAGDVLFAGQRGGYGNMIVIDHGRGLITHYGHLNRILVKAGEHVERGDHIGAVGNTGRSTGPHLHYEVRENGIPTNPRRYVLE